MNPHNLQPESRTQPSTTAIEVLKRIEVQAITPISRFQFICAQWGVWIVWLGTILVGAAALAVSLYVTMSANYALYEATHENFLTFFVAVMPYIWVCLFIAMVYLSIFQMRNTKRGYRYSSWVVILSSLMFTVVGAVLLHSFGLGYLLDQKLGQQLDSYMSQTKMEQKMWQMPQAGRLVGRLEIDTVVATEQLEPILNFKDDTGVMWRLSVTELRPRDSMLLLKGERVRLLGTTTNDVSFHVCGVFPAMGGRAMGIREMERERLDFDEMMTMHRRLMVNSESATDQNEHAEVPKDRLCSHLEMMKRMR